MSPSPCMKYEHLIVSSPTPSTLTLPLFSLIQPLSPYISLTHNHQITMDLCLQNLTYLTCQPGELYVFLPNNTVMSGCVKPASFFSISSTMFTMLTLATVTKLQPLFFV